MLMDPHRYQNITQFDRLLGPIDLGPFALPIRMFCTGHTPNYSAGGQISDQEIAYHVRKAEGGIPLSTTGVTSVHPSGGGTSHMLANWDDSVVSRYQVLARAMHDKGARMMVQLGHLSATFSSDHAGHAVWAPSQVMGEYARELPHVMTRREIEEVLDAYHQAARRVRAGDLDGVEILAFAGTLPIAFLSPFTNRRSDAYGGDFERRLRFMLELVRTVRDALGPDLALSIKLAVDELVDGGLRLPDAQRIVERIDATGAVNFYVAATGNNLEKFARVDHWPPTPTAQGLYAHLAAGLRKATSRPVAALTRIVDPRLAETLIADGTCDMVAMVRATIADPDLPNKLKAGRLSDVRPCTGVNSGCVDRVLAGGEMRCIHNPVIGREREWAHVAPSTKSLKLVVIGGGPAGMEAARHAAERGHRVVLFEREAELGGTTRVAARVPGRDELSAIPRWLSGQLERLQVDVRLRCDASLEVVRKEQPDRTIVATGAAVTEPVVDIGRAGLPVVSAHAVISGAVRPGRNVLIIDHTGKHVGCAAAELVADAGGRAQVVSRLFHPAIDFGLTNLVSLYRRLYQKGVVLSPHHDLRGIENGIVSLRNCYGGVEQVIADLDMVIVVTPPLPNDRLLEELTTAGFDAEAIGDCVAPRDVETAIFEGHRAAIAI
jgi:2,4-dienoyl-CoA reductase-like NADH-dependent reductase (Old Yellow Enzyme family)/thioredoxin reductase